MNSSLQNRYRRVRSAKEASNGKCINTNEINYNGKSKKTEGLLYEVEKQQKNMANNFQTSLYNNAQSRLRQKLTKQPEQLLQQNIHLKNELNSLSKKFQIQKSKIEIQRKKNNFYSRRINRQFQKQLYWQGQKNNEYLITGIKHQYEKIKLMFQEKCIECEQLRKTITMTQIQQIMTYCDALQTENKILIQNLSFLKMDKNRSEFSVSKRSTKQINLQSLILEERRKNQKIKQKIVKYQDKIQQYVNKEKELQKKIGFLQKVIIEKENNSHHANKKAKAIKKENEKLLVQVKQLQTKILQKDQKSKLDIEQVKNQNVKKQRIQKQMFEKCLRQKDFHIQKLQKEIGYLSTLLSYWKPLDELNVKDNPEYNRSSLKQKNTASKLKITNNSQQPINENFNRAKTPNKLQNDKYTVNDIKILNEEEYFANKDISNQSILLDEELGKSNYGNKSVRESRRSNKKWCDDVKKCRKINLSEVQHLGEMIKYKMIGLNKKINDVKENFSAKLQNSNNSHKNDQLITMKQIKMILITSPFNLNEDDAFKLSRYISQQEGGQFVYCHQDNQIERSIVKSIIRTLLGSYEIPGNEESQQKWKQIKKSYCYNMQLALKSIYPKGLISKNKLLELIKSLGIEIQDGLKDYLIGMLVKDAQSLNELSYQLLFTEEEQIH